MYKEYQNFKKQASVAYLKPTTADIEGPFYKPDAPYRATLTSDWKLHLTGVIRDVYGSSISGGVTLDFWQADGNGVYDNEGFNFRGKVVSDHNGIYHLYTIHPGFYQIGENEYRCSHIHVKLSHRLFKPLTTQLYFTNDKYDDTDHWFSADRTVGPADVHDAIFDFVLATA